MKILGKRSHNDANGCRKPPRMVTVTGKLEHCKDPNSVNGGFPGTQVISPNLKLLYYLYLQFQSVASEKVSSDSQTQMKATW